METENIYKKVQYVTVDSDFIGPCNNVFTVNYGFSSTYSNVTNTNTYTGSNVFVQEIKNVIGIKLVDFYVTQVGEGNATGYGAAKYIDIICNDVPDAAQILDERKSRIFARIPLERDFGSSNVIVNDKQWKSFNRQTNYFNPISIKKLNFQLWEMLGGNNDGTKGDYRLLQPDAAFYMILEITTIDNTVITLPKEDSSIKIVNAIEELSSKFDLIQPQAPIVNVSTPDVVIPPLFDKKYQMYLIVLVLVLIIFLMLKK